MTFLWLALLGAALTMDGVTVGQFMITRPVVAGGLAGLVLGDPVTGFLVGGILEAFLLVAVPSGGGRFPEPGSATVVGVAGAVWTGGGGGGGLALGIAAALVLGYVGALTQSMQRHLNERWIPDPAEGPVTPGAVVRGHVTSIVVDGVRGFGLTAMGLLAVHALGPVAVSGWPLAQAQTRAFLLVGAFVSLGILGRALLGGRRWLLLALGLASGLLAGWGLTP